MWVNYLAKLEKLTWKQGDGDVMEDWSASCFLPLLLFSFASPLFLVFSAWFLPARPLFCVCFVILWPSVFFSSSLYYLCSCVCVFFLLFCLLSPSLSLVFPGFSLVCFFGSPSCLRSVTSGSEMKGRRRLVGLMLVSVSLLSVYVLVPLSPQVLFVSWNFLCFSSSVPPLFARSPGFSSCSRFSPQFFFAPSFLLSRSLAFVARENNVVYSNHKVW